MSGGDVEEPAPPFQPEQDPFLGFEMTVAVDRSAYRVGEVVRVTVAVTNDSPRFAVHRYPGWRRFELTVRDVHHRVVATGGADAAPGQGGFTDRWLPGQMAIFPVYWSQHTGPVVPAWSSDPPGPRAEPGTYRVRVAWLGRVPDQRGQPVEAHSSWFELV